LGRNHVGGAGRGEKRCILLLYAFAIAAEETGETGSAIIMGVLLRLLLFVRNIQTAT
jgi:hypothetical protein